MVVCGVCSKECSGHGYAFSNQIPISLVHLRVENELHSFDVCLRGIEVRLGLILIDASRELQL